MSPHAPLPSSGWTQRFRLLSKTMVYVFSADVRFSVRLGTGRSYLSAIREDGPLSTYHVNGSPTVVTAYGNTEEVLAARVCRGEGEVVQDLGPAADSVNGLLTLATEENDLVLVEYSGVLNPRGGVAWRDTRAIRQHLEGSLFLSSRQETAQARYRWLVRGQLFWVGRFREVWAKGSDLALLRCSFDVYSAG
jgi:hypothetical protein